MTKCFVSQINELSIFLYLYMRMRGRFKLQLFLVVRIFFFHLFHKMKHGRSLAVVYAIWVMCILHEYNQSIHLYTRWNMNDRGNFSHPPTCENKICVIKNRNNTCEWCYSCLLSTLLTFPTNFELRPVGRMNLLLWHISCVRIAFGASGTQKRSLARSLIQITHAYTQWFS